MIFGQQDTQASGVTTGSADDGAASFTAGAQPSTIVAPAEPVTEAPTAPVTTIIDEDESPSALQQDTAPYLDAVEQPDLTAEIPSLSDETAATDDAFSAPAPQPVADPIASAPLPSDDATQTVPQDDDAAPVSAGADADLLVLKQQALNDLGPLVDHLDQTPEEKFRTTMMMIQSTDNQAFIKDAYAAAQAITDDKVRAQALLDVVNEINYFTHQKDQA